MTQKLSSDWLIAIRETIHSYRRMIDSTVSQLSDDELVQRPAPGINSVAIILRHLGGNLVSRWTDFLTTDGEKPDRNRDTEFEDWSGDRQSLMDYFDRGWNRLLEAVDLIESTQPDQEILIRGESHTLAQALTRSVTHITYHVGQISLVSRMVHQGDWNWQTIAPGTSEKHNESTWGTTASRSVFGKTDPK